MGSLRLPGATLCLESLEAYYPWMMGLECEARMACSELTKALQQLHNAIT